MLGVVPVTLFVLGKERASTVICILTKLSMSILPSVLGSLYAIFSMVAISL